MKIVRLALTLVLAALGAGCDSPSVPGPQVPAQLEVVGGDDQQGVVGRELADALVVRVLDDKGKPFRGAVVNFRVTSGGGSVFAGASLTNENGEARERWTLGTAAADSQRVEVRAVDAATGQALVLATFRATAHPDAAEAVAALGPATRTGDAGHPMADSLAARVTDRYGNGVPGSVVVWSVTGGGGTVSPAQGTTDAQGVARTSFTLGTRLDSLHTAEASISPAVRAQFSATAGLPMGTQLSKVSGDGQDGGVGDPLGAPLVVRLALADGRPIVGATLVWSIASGEGTLTPPTSVTDGDGQAQAAWRLGTRSGPQGVVATIQSLTTIFTAAAAPGPPATFVKAGGDDQTGYAGSAVADSLAVRLTDAYGNPVPGFMVTWSVPRGGGSISPAQTRSGADGVARASWTLGTLLDSPHAAEASIGPATRVQFGAWASLPMGATLTKVSGDGQQASVDEPLEAPLVVRLALPDGRPLVGGAVRWEIGTGAGSVTPALTFTDADGRAQTEWRLGTVFGPQGVVATHLSLSTIFSANAGAGPPAALAKAGGDGQTGPTGSVLPDSLGVRLRDARGNPVAGATVTWSVLRGGGSVSPAQATTGADGVARARWTLGTRVDSIQSVAAETAPGLRLQFNAAATVPPGAALAVVSGNGQTAPVGTALAAPVVVALRTADGRAIVGAPVTFSAAPGSGTLAPASGVTDANGHAQATWTMGTRAGAATATAGSPGAASVALAATAATGPAAALNAVSGHEQTGEAGKPLPAPMVVQVTDAYGNPVAGAPVQWTVVTGGGSASPAAVATGADGTASTTWTLGSTAGSQSIRASSGSLPTALMTATAVVSEPIVITVRMPQPTQVVGDSVRVQAAVNVSTSSLRSFTAQVAGRVVNLVPVTGGESAGTLMLNGLPAGPLTLRVRAESLAGDTAVVDVPFTKDAPPTVVVQAPVRGTVARPQVRVDAECIDDDPAGCSRITVLARTSSFESSPVLAQGTTSLHATVTVPATLDGREVIFHVLGTDSRGQNSATQVIGYVEHSPRWTEEASRGTQLLDYDDQRVLYMGPDGSVSLANRAGGGEVVMRAPFPNNLLFPYAHRGWLYPQGAIISAGAQYELRNGTVQNLGGHSMRVAGSWAIWRDGGTNGGTAGSLFRRDLTSATTQLVDRANEQDVAANGDVVFSNEDWDIMRRRGGVTTRLTPVSDLRNTHPVTDGINVVFLRTPIFINTNGAQIILITPTGAEVVLAPSNFLQTPMAPGQDYAVNGGWTAFTRVSNSIKQVWVRSPSSVLYQATSGTVTATARSVGPNGELVFARQGRMYLLAPPFTAAPVDIGALSIYTRLEWRDGQLLAFLGRSAFTISY